MPHINKLIDFVVAVLIIHQDKVLLVQHKKLKKWLPIGGHIEFSENPDEALFREVREECGLEIELLNEKPNFEDPRAKSLYTPSFVNIHVISETHKHVCLYYIAITKSDDVKLNKEEHDDIRWFSETNLDNLEFNIPTAIKFYAKEALKKAKEK